MENANGASRGVVPTEGELTAALQSLRSESPALGTPKVHALLLAQQPTWSVSEKRTRKVLQALGLVLSSGNSSSKPTGDRKYPASQLNPSLPLEQMTNAVKTKYFNDAKGKGLVATRKIEKGEVMWKEDPFALAAEWELYELQNKSLACFYCSTPMSHSSNAVLRCTSTSDSLACPATFCNRLCRSRAESLGGHSMLCPGANPASNELLAFVEKSQWQALHALSRCTARLVMRKKAAILKKGGQKERAEVGKAFEDDWAIYTALAVLSYEDRFKYAEEMGGEPDRAAWQKAHKLLVNAFDKERRKSNLAHDPVFDEELFSYEGFLRGLGRMSLNMESHGGIYAVHSHINHSCTPNTSVRHHDQSNALSRITVLASSDIEAGEELVITYVDPSLGVRERRKRLAEWGFGKCTCGRCMEEEKSLPPQIEPASGQPAAGPDMSDLSAEIKAGLGLL
ncbi:SET domain-containing protein [Pterulicium gracile]|uniref:Histone-lysine N-methyltransferase SET5 n=1 Tax=Pterulicium gracile TaxID=1884261 RepID=A0A5C3QCR1_9AGAR|nr:SET domain-containing protein [Pterula gracilis]